MIKSYKLRRHIANGLIYLLLIILGIIWISPFVYLVMHSFRGEGLIAVDHLIPQQWTFKNYIDLFTGSKNTNA